MRALLAAGGTGGHLFPAQALASVLAARGHEVTLVTDHRAAPYVETFPARVHMVASDTVRGRSPAALARLAKALASGFLRSRAIVASEKPTVAVGFGGYPTLPPLFAARSKGVPVIVHEANAVAGRANRLLARFAHVATSFPQVKGLPEGAQTHVGIPVREAVRAAAAPYSPSIDEFRLLVFGGSQGARAFADIVPPALGKLNAELRGRLRVTQQCRPEDMERVRAAYEAAGIAADLAPFFADLPARMAAAHLVIARSGASTVAELSIIGRPALLVPLPGAIDQDQAYNASAMAALGGAKRLDQGVLSPERLAHEVGTAMLAPEALAAAAEAAKGLAQPDAAERLADLCEGVAQRSPR
ncbi:undecaprenyldiphospho-muramoylpentapeptide beta-N-acetylglucosaminyltransferase [Acuticoccus mangrovi]|uniref:UDP-N-acetylglucosamine--N-acetylmuramyl-(pentapeptide) pyrophosphoryl-undecaprenol N-acetylglucosamine transferase n=1 Tax=Acuticoccus mangrovi TaxID=2796142 RepID=A0A934MFH8_9HYPH|nr:undecaprenyldiphospho-muramoylpentapeptide beta-N-acetylglucosaminyltransferase [Acuticoccus mangrovi]MBJ3774940.1 undecaprenyldiphospho-muramoylpentapeptide beta-N-acetylglucosaminyltransferase [Acuticoccus mangrovi]